MNSPKAQAEATSDVSNDITDDVNADNAEDQTKKQRKPRKPPAVAWKKPKGMPKRPLSAYNLFFKVQREAIMTARANDKSEAAAKRSKKETVGIGFANLARTIADKWQSLDNADKAEYLEQAAKEKARYKQEMVVWRKKQKEEKELQASMPPPSIMPPNQAMMGMGGMHARNPYDDSRIHPGFWQAGGLAQNSYQLFAMHQQQQSQHQQSPMMMNSYLQELSDTHLLQRQQQHLQELQARHQLLLTGSLDTTNRTSNDAAASAAASYPDTWFELNQRQQAMQQLNQQLNPSSDGELQKLNPSWAQAQLLRDQSIQGQLQGNHHQGVDVGLLKDLGDLKKAAPAGMDASGNNQPSSSLHNLVSKLDNDTISFLTEFRFNGNNSSGSEGTP